MTALACDLGSLKAVDKAVKDFKQLSWVQRGTPPPVSGWIILLAKAVK